MKKLNHILAAGVLAALASSCGPEPAWQVKGTVEGAEPGTRLALEACNAGHWYVLDSVDVRNGAFDYKAAEPVHGTDIFRLTLPGKGSIYFSVDSAGMVTVTATAANFGTGHKLAGNDAAGVMAAIDSIAASTADRTALQRALTGFVTADTTGLIAYYAVCKSVDGHPVFDPNESFGNRVYGAAAQVFAHYRPLDPRGVALRKAYFDGRRALGKIPDTPDTVLEVPETGIIEIARYDDRGVHRSLTELASQGKVVLLSFTDYSLETSPAYNAMLNDLYELYHSKGLEIYQIAFNANELSWKEAARNLPWITVWNSPEDGVAPLASYNVGALPLTFIIKRDGDLGQRVADSTDLPRQVAKYF